MILFSWAFLFLCLLTILVGLLATATFDLLYLVIYLVNGSIVDWTMLGRISAYFITKGEFIAFEWASMPPVYYENAIGWCVHYSVGVVYAFFYVYFILKQFKYPNKVWKSISFLLVMTVFPFFVLDPLSGSGILDLKTVHPVINILLTFCVHSFYGLFLWAWVQIFYFIYQKHKT